MCVTGACSTSRAGTATTFRATGRAFTNVSRDTAVTAFACLWFTYVMRFTCVVLFVV